MSAATKEDVSVDSIDALTAEVEALKLANSVLMDERDDAYRQGFYEGRLAGIEEVSGDGWEDE